MACGSNSNDYKTGSYPKNILTLILLTKKKKNIYIEREITLYDL